GQLAERLRPRRGVKEEGDPEGRTERRPRPHGSSYCPQTQRVAQARARGSGRRAGAHVPFSSRAVTCKRWGARREGWPSPVEGSGLENRQGRKPSGVRISPPPFRRATNRDTSGASIATAGDTREQSSEPPPNRSPQDAWIVVRVQHAVEPAHDRPPERRQAGGAKRGGDRPPRQW